MRCLSSDVCSSDARGARAKNLLNGWTQEIWQLTIEKVLTNSFFRGRNPSCSKLFNSRQQTRLLSIYPSYCFGILTCQQPELKKVLNWIMFSGPEAVHLVCLFYLKRVVLKSSFGVDKESILKPECTWYTANSTSTFSQLLPVIRCKLWNQHFVRHNFSEKPE